MIYIIGWIAWTCIALMIADIAYELAPIIADTRTYPRQGNTSDNSLGDASNLGTQFGHGEAGK